MHISIETVEGKNINLEVEDSSETIDLKIHGATRQLVLRLGSDSSPVPVPSEIMKISIETLSGKTFYLGVRGSNTIKEIMIKCEEKDGTPFNQQRLFFEGMPLDSDKTVAEYNIKNGSTIVLYVNQCGC